MKQSGWDETIVALATPPGVGALGVIRLSGNRAIQIAGSLVPARDLRLQDSHTAFLGVLRENGRILDEAVVTLFKGPKSYTGEDVVEFSCHGSPFILEQVITACIHAGARLAKPGEFTLRAFLNGKLDLAQAEAVADLIASNSAASSETAIRNMRGGFSTSLKGLREQLIRFSALIELELDFSQEDVEFADRNQLFDLVEGLGQQTRKLLESFSLGNVIKNGVQVAIIGKPNAGKSTLLNTLLNENRAIVSHIAGTTRDTIEEIINIGGVLFRLIDTAGIRDHSNDEIELQGMNKSLEKASSANIVIYLFDSSSESLESLEPVIHWLDSLSRPYLLVGNKADISLIPDTIVSESGEKTLFISAKNNRGIDSLKSSLLEMSVGGVINTEATIITNARHYHSLLQLEKSLNEIKRGLDNHIPGDLLALDIRQSLYLLGEITGEINNEEQLDYIFSKFCIGK